MSASRKKMLRREETKTAMTERQQQEQKESKKLRVYTVLFVIAIVLMVGVVIATSVSESGIIERNTTALTVNDTDISAVELNYFYGDTINQFINTYGSYVSMMGLDTSLPLNEQYTDEEKTQTWADYMLEMTLGTVRSSYAMYLDAAANNYVLPEEALEEIETTISNLEAAAAVSGYANSDGYLKAMYGPGSNLKSFRHYLNVQSTANHYYADTVDAMEYSDEQLRAVEADNFNKYSSYSYDYYFLPASSFYEGGTTDEEGNTTYSEEEMEAGRAMCEDTAKSLAQCTSLEDLNDAISSLEINADKQAGTTAATDRLYTSISNSILNWLTAEDRQAGDIGYVENTVTSADDDGNEVTTVNGYYLLHYVGSTDNTYPLVNVRHILLNHTGGSTDESGATTYTDEEKAATYARAEELLSSFTSGEATEDAFAALADTHSEDPGSNTNGGLYENIYPGEMIANFNDWCFDESRQPGDTGIVEGNQGYHIMYFCGYTDYTYRDYMITQELLNADVTEWQNAIYESVEVTTVDTSNVIKDVTLTTAA